MSAGEKLRVYQNACRDHSVPSAVVHQLHEAYLAEVRSSPATLNGNDAVAILGIVFTHIHEDDPWNTKFIEQQLAEAGYTRALFRQIRGS